VSASPVTRPAGRIAYGVGNCVVSPPGQACWSGEATFGPYLAFGYAAARSIVDEQVGEER